MISKRPRTLAIDARCPTSGAASSFEETLNTLKYANRAKNIKTNATRNSLDVNHHITEYVNLIGSLRSEIARLKHQLLRSGRGHRGAGNDRPEVAYDSIIGTYYSFMLGIDELNLFFCVNLLKKSTGEIENAPPVANLTWHLL